MLWRMRRGLFRPSRALPLVTALLLAACSSSPVVPSQARPSALPSGSAGQSAASGTQAPGGSPVASPIDTAGWVLVRMHTLGYAMELPPTFETVTDDTETPVPSIAAIESIAPELANGLRVQASRLASSAGVFGELGVWAVEPQSLAQVGVLAGRPYRIAEADLEGIVQSAVAARAAPLEGSSIDRVELPAGTGFLASYRDAGDLGVHREIHLRTPSGRYLVLAMSFVTSAIDRTAEQRFLAMAGSLAPLPGDESGDMPAPSTGPAGHADPDLESMLPESVGGIALQKRSANGEELIGGDLGSGTVLDALASLVRTPGQVSFALAVPVEGSSVVLSAYRLEGVDASAIDARLAGFPAEVWSRTSVGGRDVLVSVAGSDGRKTYLRVSGNVVEEVTTADGALAEEAVAALH
ncbi:MAG: hypothetical protein QOH61_348 [Chloroflexota bacterium]|jgi:hypothetical protein|nr:hypothetical protein [Chloroflexota bacterium]